MADKLRGLRSVGIAVGLLGIALAVFLWPSSDDSGDVQKRERTMPAIKPDGVPDDAVFRGGSDGGYYIRLRPAPFQLSDGRQLDAYHIEIYHSFSGDVEYQGTGLYVPPRELGPSGQSVFLPAPPVERIMETAFYHFGALEFPVEGTADPGRIVPVPVR